MVDGLNQDNQPPVDTQGHFLLALQQKDLEREKDLRITIFSLTGL